MELIIILILFIYIAFLHYQLMKKNLFLESIVEKLSSLDKGWNKDIILSFLKKLQSISSESIMKEDKILHDNILNYLIENKNCRTFVIFIRTQKIRDYLRPATLAAGAFCQQGCR